MAKIISHPTEPIHKGSSSSFQNGINLQHKRGAINSKGGTTFEQCLCVAQEKVKAPSVLDRMKRVYGWNNGKNTDKN